MKQGQVFQKLSIPLDIPSLGNIHVIKSLPSSPSKPKSLSVQSSFSELSFNFKQTLLYLKKITNFACKVKLSSDQAIKSTFYARKRQVSWLFQAFENKLRYENWPQLCHHLRQCANKLIDHRRTSVAGPLANLAQVLNHLLLYKLRYRHLHAKLKWQNSILNKY